MLSSRGGGAMRDESRYYCLYNTHVLSGAKVIGYVGAFLSVAGIISSLMVCSWASAALSVVTALAYASVILAQRSRQPRLYVPYLVINGTGLVFNLVYVIFLACMFFSLPTFWQREVVQDPHQHGKQLRDNARVVTGVILAMMLLAEALTLWFQSIVYRAYLYMREESTNLVIPRGAFDGE